MMHIPLQSFAQWGPHHGPHEPMGPDWIVRSGLAPWNSAAGTGLEILLPLIWALLLGVLLVGVVYLLSTRRTGSRTDQATALLRERYARGEISDDEFENRTARLGEHGDGRASS